MKAAAPKPGSTKRSPDEAPPRAPRPRAHAARPRARAHPPHAELSPLARSLGEIAEAPATDHDPGAARRVMELHWGDEPPSRPDVNDIVTRWTKRGDTLLRHLAEHGAARYEYRADLRGGRFVWIDPDGRVSVEASARVLCRWSPTTSALVMGWADPLLRKSGVARLDGFAAERDGIDEEDAWRVAMEAAEAARAEFLYRVTTPDAWYFLALDGLCFDPRRTSFRPTTPVGLVLGGLSDTRRAVESRAEPTDVLRERLAALGRALVHEAEYAYRGSDWVARLERTGRRLINLADRLPRASYKSVAAGQPADDWLGREAVLELCESLSLLEDEWSLFA